MVAFRNLFVLALVTIAVSSAFADEAAEHASTAAPGHSGKHHPKDVKKRAASGGLSHEKYQAVLKVYTEEGPLDEKNKKADEVAKDFSESEKKVVEAIKKFFGKRAEAIAKLSDESKTILKEIKELRNKQKAAFDKIKEEDKKAANFLLFAHAPQSLHSRPSRDGHGDRHQSTDVPSEGTATPVAA